MKLIGVPEVAKLVGHSQQWTRTLIRRGQIKATQLGGRWLVDPADVEAYIMKRVESTEGK